MCSRSASLRVTAWCAARATADDDGMWGGNSASGGWSSGVTRENHGALDDVFELAHIAGPVIGRQRGHRRGRDRLNAFVQAARIFVHKVPHEEGNVVASLAQRRDHDGEDVQPVIEVAAKVFRGDHLRQVHVRGGDQAGIGMHGPGASQPLEGALLEHPQQLGLQLEGQIADLVEQQRAAMRQLEAADAAVRWRR